MKVLDALERRFGWIAIPGLIRIVVALTALVYLLTFLNPDFLSILALNPARIRHGEVWRLVTYIFIPGSLGAPGGTSLFSRVGEVFERFGIVRPSECS